MSVSRILELSELRAVLRLGEAVRAAPDPLNRKRQLLLGLSHLVGAAGGACVMIHHDRRSRRNTVISVVTAIVDGNDATSELLLSDIEREIADHGDGNFSALPESGIVKVPGPAMSGGDAEAVRLRQTRAYRKGKCVYSNLHIGDSGLTANLRICFARKCTPRQLGIIDLLHREMGWIYRQDLPLASPEALALSPRQRDVLELLLNGDSEKQIAGKLDLSQNTVHHHAKAIHRHFNVSSRSELLARWVGK